MKFEEISKTVLDAENSAFFYTPPYYSRSKSYLFKKPVEVLIAKNANEVIDLLETVNKLIKDGLSCYALINYESGYAFENKLNHLLNSNGDELLRFVFFEPENVSVFQSGSIRFFSKVKDHEYAVSDFVLNTGKDKYYNDISKIKDYIKQGDTYQVNYTVKGGFRFAGDPGSMFTHLIFNQSARYSAMIKSGGEVVLSLSPELFFEIKNNTITSKPMKGTLMRGVEQSEDKILQYSLHNSQKNRAENVMIVDLIRNDIGRISEFSSVKVKNLFEVEKYESLFQMVSTVSGKVKNEITFSDVIRNLFPCGSITGAPKIRTMEIINELETDKRGIYTGSIGFIHRHKTVFNVAIRSAVLKKNKSDGDFCKGTIGLGSGIVWDSEPQKEYEETLLKSSFLLSPDPYFEIFETMLAEKNEIHLLQDHLNRLSTSADFFLFKFNRKNAEAKIKKAIANLDSEKLYRIKILLNKIGMMRIQKKEFKHFQGIVKVIISPNSTNKRNKFLYHKTTNRKLYDEEFAHYSAQSFFDVLYFNEDGYLTEGATTNIFIRCADNWFTPGLSEGILPGVYRHFFIKNNFPVIESKITLEDLQSADRIILTNALRGEINVSRVYLNESEYIDL